MILSQRYKARKDKGECLREIMAYRLGFLLCDHVMEPFAEQFPDYPDMFAEAFGEVSTEIEWRVYDITREELPPDPNACDGYLISGSRHGAYDELPWIARLETSLGP